MSETALLLTLSVFSLISFTGLSIAISYLNKWRARHGFSWQKNKPQDSLYFAKQASRMQVHVPYSLNAEFILLAFLILILSGALIIFTKEKNVANTLLLSLPSLITYALCYGVIQKVKMRHKAALADILNTEK